jgi:hypothetical protein
MPEDSLGEAENPPSIEYIDAGLAWEMDEKEQEEREERYKLEREDIDTRLAWEMEKKEREERIERYKVETEAKEREDEHRRKKEPEEKHTHTSSPGLGLTKDLFKMPSTESGYASTDGYSPSTQPTPQSETHRMSIDGAMNVTPILPPPVPSMQPLTINNIPAHGSGGFQCDYPGCAAGPFQTQYLLK